MHKLLSYLVLSLVISMALASCHESIEDRAERESKEYTEKFCPTPPQNNVVTDSLVFNKTTKTQTYYMTLTGPIDNYDAIKGHEKELSDAMLNSLRQNPGIETYKDAGFIFEYICRSQNDPKRTYLHCKFGPKDYSTK